MTPFARLGLRLLLLTVLLASDSPAATPPPDTAIRAVDNYEQWKSALDTGKGVPAPTLTVLPGFAVETLRVAQPDEGSWVALAFDLRGRLMVAREKRGLLRFTLTPGGLSAEVMDDTLEEVRGLLDTPDGLYANANGSKGLFRLRDTNRDDRPDEIVPLIKTRAGGHGRNALALTPDGLIAMIHGDAVDFPPAMRKLTPPTVAGLLPGDDLPRGHFIRTDREGREWTLVASGLRNPVGVDFNVDGEAFTYDADAEMDMGMPWYRPTHVRHLVSGAEFGWRRVTGRWPPYYADQADNPPTLLTLGKGSPTAIKFGTRSQFPPQYRNALYIMDWAYGRIVAVHLSPEGASYTARAETFVRGRPLNVTGLDFGPDGAMYFVTGGRNTQSALYRVRQVGPATPETPATPVERSRIETAAKARALRRNLETFHGRHDGRAIETAWPYLDATDPWIAHAARVAIEHQPVSEWLPRALSESLASRALPALLSLTRVAGNEVLPQVMQRLVSFPMAGGSAGAAGVFIRTATYGRQRLGSLDSSVQQKLTTQLNLLVPHAQPEVNREGMRLLLALEAPGAVAKATRLLAAAQVQEEKLHYLHLLGGARSGWTESDRARLFRGLREMPTFRGGAGLPQFLRQIREAALATVPENERPRYAAMLETPAAAAAVPVAAEPAPRPFVREWRMADFTEQVGSGQRAVNLERGKALYAAAQCIACHRLGDEGGVAGPDLTDAASRFSTRDILESMIEPSRVISETYRHVVVTTKAGASHTGRIMPVDYRLPVLRLASDPRSDDAVEIAKDDIASYAESEVSPMPPGLLNQFTRDEIMDLIAYIEAGAKQ